MRAKSFFYVCAGLFLLALGYHLGAGNATAQSGMLSWGGIAADACGIDGAGNFYSVQRDGGRAAQVWQYPPPVAGDIVSVEASGDAGFVLKSNGDVYRAFVNGPWVLTASLYSGGPTPAQRESMGRVKVRYR